MVEHIAAIDIKAAEWIMDHRDELLERKYSLHVTKGRESNSLSSMFTWAESDQGWDYWESINDKLKEKM